MPLVTTTFNQKTLIRIALVIAFVQFTNALEYMMFSPVFTFMAADFAVPVTFSGYVSGMYTSGAVLSGIIAFYWVDRCNKKRFLIANMVLLAMATLLTTLTTSFSSSSYIALFRRTGWRYDNGCGDHYFDKPHAG